MYAMKENWTKYSWFSSSSWHTDRKKALGCLLKQAGMVPQNFRSKNRKKTSRLNVVDHWSSLKILGGLMKERLTLLSKKPGSEPYKNSRNFWNFLFLIKKREINIAFHMAFQYSCFYSQLKQRKIKSQKIQNNDSIAVRACWISHTWSTLQEKFQKGGSNWILLLPGSATSHALWCFWAVNDWSLWKQEVLCLYLYFHSNVTKKLFGLLSLRDLSNHSPL